MLFYILKIYNKNIPGTLTVSVAVDVDVVVEDEETTRVKGEERGTKRPEISASLEGFMSVLCCKKLQYNFFATLSIYIIYVIMLIFVFLVHYGEKTSEYCSISKNNSLYVIILCFMHIIYITFILGVTYNYNFIIFVYVMLLYLKKQFHSKNKYNNYNLN